MGSTGASSVSYEALSLTNVHVPVFIRPLAKGFQPECNRPGHSERLPSLRVGSCESCGSGARLSQPTAQLRRGGERAVTSRRVLQTGLYIEEQFRVIHQMSPAKALFWCQESRFVV
ncbi:hypothetical protein AOLI_G00160900 [Acnodon oligacanthus]